jgi:hypothetical protein
MSTTTPTWSGTSAYTVTISVPGPVTLATGQTVALSFTGGTWSSNLAGNYEITVTSGGNPTTFTFVTPINPSLLGTFTSVTVTTHVAEWSLSLGTAANFPYPRIYPYEQTGFMMKHLNGGALDTDRYGGPFGFTESGSPRGVGLAVLGATMNSQRRWTFKQPGVALAARATPQVFTLGGGAGFPFADPGLVDVLSGAPLWGCAQPRVRVSVELPNVQEPVTAASADSPIVITSTNTLVNGDTVLITGVEGNTAANGVWVVTNVSAGTTFSLNGSTANGTYVMGTGSCQLLGRGIASVTAGGGGAIEITTNANHGYVTGDTVFISGVAGSPTISTLPFTITNTGLTSFTLNGTVFSGSYTPIREPLDA